MKIGEKTYSSSRKPTDLDEKLIAATGVNAREMAAILAGTPLAGQVAQALLPFLPEKDRPFVSVLASEIAAAGVAVVAREVAKLYTDDPATTAPAAGGHPGGAA